ncbi:MAG: Asp-tRNA(Asn)/Glu-tRNA(Gln) amidotransferase subunit GatC [Bacteriovoracaceae bacterium]|nr:Asp-tRNA(Asn)/Glu-tRNA(Gln) amidotransferase subunit GatC [Bacteriovoracaceae bacterium]
MSEFIVSKETVKHVAKLARLEIAESEVASFQQHMQKILNYVKELDAVDTNGIEPLYSPVYENLDLYYKTSPLRHDEIQASLEVDALLKNAPQASQGQFKVEAVIEEE